MFNEGYRFYPGFRPRRTSIGVGQPGRTSDEEAPMPLSLSVPIELPPDPLPGDPFPGAPAPPEEPSPAIDPIRPLVPPGEPDPVPLILPAPGQEPAVPATPPTEPRPEPEPV